ncbi:MAG TPA: ATP-binding protein [Symbiobacteriaceae bacterium]|nr:ATP-binding protein [Symbiobacteriaceae bacterium]
MNQVEIMRAVWEVTADGLVISGPDTVIREVNPAYCAMTGYTEAELVGKKTNIIASGITPRAVYNEMWEQLRTTGRWSGELINRRPDGKLWISAISICAILWPNGDVAAYVGIARDLTEDRRLREALQEQSSRLEAILEAITMGILLFDKSGRCAKANHAALRILERSEAELIGASQPELTELFGAHFVEPDPLSVSEADRILSTQSEPVRFYRASWEPVTTADGAELGQILVLNDITRETELDRMKEEFIATVSHELRTPLTAMKGSLGLLAGGVLGAMAPMQSELVQIALQNTDRLIRQVSEILSLSKLESGKVQMRLAPVDLNRLAGDVLAELSTVPSGRQITVTTELTADLPPVAADGEQLRQVLVNLLGNAYKFTPEGGRVHLQTVATETEVQVIVSDSGPGIAADQLERIFERFTRAPGEASRRASGTGLGLAIARNIVEQHGGRIWAESAPGQGATFTVALPRVTA